MKKSERLNGIVLLLKSKGRLSCTDLAQHFEVSERTIYRDIDALSQLKIPVIAYEGAGGGYEISADYFMPNFKLSKDEITILLMVLKLGDQLKLPNLSSHYNLLESKIINALGEKDLVKTEALIKHISFYISKIEPKTYEEDILSIILEAISEASQVTFSYRAPRNNALTSRTISIHEMFFDEGGWYIMGFCHLREEKRTFRLDRMSDVKKLDESAALTKELKSTTERFLETKFKLMMRHSFYRVIKENDYMNGHKICNDGDRLTIETTTFYREYIIQMILSNPEEIELLEPQDCLEIIQSKIKKLAKLYN